MRKLKPDSWSDPFFRVYVYLNPDKSCAEGEIYNLSDGTSISLSKFIYYDADGNQGYPSDLVAFIYRYLRTNNIDSRSLKFKP